jgi:hypothetical protein
MLHSFVPPIFWLVIVLSAPGTILEIRVTPNNLNKHPYGFTVSTNATRDGVAFHVAIAAKTEDIYPDSGAGLQTVTHKKDGRGLHISSESLKPAVQIILKKERRVWQADFTVARDILKDPDVYFVFNVLTHETIKGKSITMPSVDCYQMRLQEFVSDAPLRYYDAQYDLPFFLPASWKGYSVLHQEWDGGGAWRGPIIVFRNPQWRTNDPYQDIPVMVFTRSQWEVCGKNGGFFPYAAGVITEMWHNPKYVFGIYSRYNAADSVKGWTEAAEIVDGNRDANDMPHLHSE